MPYPFIPYQPKILDIEEVEKEALAYFNNINSRRSVREFSSKPVSKQTIELIIKTASSAPSGANKQPWHFAAISNAALKSQIRIAAEEEEQRNYHERMSEEWLRDLEPLGTDEHKPFIEIAPWIIVMFKKAHDIVEGEKRKNYYVSESAGIAAGFLISAIHNAGLATLTHTPSPMDFLGKILNRPANERAFLLLPVGYPASDAMVPDISRKPLEKVATFYE
ncbi:MAG: nitroreductase family protein [Bacteroidetes bacterium]|nr:nitroreductase family protein [Bacteroidota bacterium]